MDNSCCCRCRAEVWHGCERTWKATDELLCKGTSWLYQITWQSYFTTTCVLRV